MRTTRTTGLVVLGLQALAASAAAQGYYYYPVPMPYPVNPLPQPATRPSLPDRPPEGILTALFRGNPKPVITPVQATAVEPVVPVPPPPPEPASWRVYGMGGVSVLRSNISGRDAFNQLSTGTVVNGANVVTRSGQSVEAFSPGTELSPLVILGVTNADGFGARARFWYFHESDSRNTANDDAAGASTAVTSVLPAPFTVISSAGGLGFLPAGTGGGALAQGVNPDLIDATHDFETLVFDLEATGRSEMDAWTLNGALGVRYASLEQRYGFSRVNRGGTAGGVTFTTDNEVSSARHRYEGVGPTAAVELTRQLGDGGLSLYGGGRGTLLLGRHHFDAETVAGVRATGLGGVIATDTTTVASSGSSRVVPVGEVEVGAQWARDLGCVTVVARAGFQVQTWFDAGTLTTTNGNIDFYGANFLLGLMY